MSKRPKSKPKGGKRLKRQHEALETDQESAFNDLVNSPGLQHVVVRIFKNLDPQTLGRCRRVSKGWKSLIESDDRWWKLVLDVSRSNFYKIIEEEIPKGTFEMSCSDFFDGVEYIEKNGTLENVKLIAEFMMEYSTKILKKFKLKIFQKGWDTPLHYAACQNRLDIFEMFASIPKMTNMNLVNCDTDATILHNACMKGQVEIVEFFLNLTHDKKIDLERGYFGKRMEFEDSFGTKMFSLAYKSGHQEVVKLFMKHAEENKLDLYEPMDDARDRSENHLLRYLENKSTGVLKLILTDPKLDVNHTNWYDGQTALHHWFGKVAKTNGRLVLRIKDEEIMAIIEALLECPRIDLAKKDKKAFCVLGVYHFGKTALHIACKYKYPERIEAYLKEARKRGNIDVNQKDDLGKTAAHHALDYGNLSRWDEHYRPPFDEDTMETMTQYFLKAAKKYGIDLEARDNKGRTPLHYLYASCDSSGEAEDFVEEAKNDYNIEFNVNAVDCNGRTPIQYRREVEIRRVRDKLISLDYF